MAKNWKWWMLRQPAHLKRAQLLLWRQRFCSSDLCYTFSVMNLYQVCALALEILLFYSPLSSQISSLMKMQTDHTLPPPPPPLCFPFLQPYVASHSLARRSLVPTWQLPSFHSSVAECYLHSCVSLHRRPILHAWSCVFVKARGEQ